MAILKGADASVLLHIRRGAPVNGRDNQGLTPLMLAAAVGREDICLVLLAEGADPAALAHERHTAFDLAIASGYDELAVRLRPPGIRVVEPCSQGDVSPLLDDPEEPADFSGPADADPWETEQGFEAASSDLALVPVVRDAQSGLSRALGRNLDTNWQDVAVRLPASPRHGAESVPDLLPVVVRGLSRGSFAPATWHMLTRRQPGIVQVLEDLGLSEEWSFLETWIADRIAPQASDRDDADDIAAALDALAAARSAWDVYTAELDMLPFVDKDAEQSMFRAMAESRHELFRLLAEAIPDVGETAIGPVTLRAKGIGGAPAPDAEIEEDSDLDTGEMADLAGPETRQTLLAVLRMVRDTGGAVEADTFEGVDVDLDLTEGFARALSSAGMIAEAARVRSGATRYLRDRNRIAEVFLPLVPRIADWYARPGIAIEDLVQEGNIALLRAVERFDYRRGNRFATYAVWWFRQACGRARDELSGLIRLPAYLVEVRTRIAEARRRLEHELGRPAEDRELAAAAGLSLQRLGMLARAGADILSTTQPEIALEAESWETGASSAYDVAFAAQRRSIVTEVIRELTPREEHIVRSRFGMGGAEERTLEEVGQSFGVTRERIRQIEHKALTRLSRPGGRFSRRLMPLLGGSGG